MEVEFNNLFNETILPETIDESSGNEIIISDNQIDENMFNVDASAQTEVDQNQDQDDIINSFLKANGISDPKKIPFENENGEIEDVDFNTLSRKEQLTMIRELAFPELSDHETEVINYLRQNNISFNDAVDALASQKLNEYLSKNQENIPQKTYSIDEYNDDELYIADLKAKYPSFSDEEILSKLNTAKVDSDLFQKEVDAIRADYKAQEDQMLKDAEIAEKQQYEDLRNSIINAVGNFNEVSLDTADVESDSLVIEDADKQQILAYLLNSDQNGKSQFAKDVENPAALIELAWFRTHGRNVIDGISQYWKDILKSERKKMANLEKQLDNYKSNKTVIVPDKKKSNSPGRNLNWDELIG